jgi:hypothetical protein
MGRLMRLIAKLLGPKAPQPWGRKRRRAKKAKVKESQG